MPVGCQGAQANQITVTSNRATAPSGKLRRSTPRLKFLRAAFQNTFPAAHRTFSDAQPPNETACGLIIADSIRRPHSMTARKRAGSCRPGTGRPDTYRTSAAARCARRRSSTKLSSASSFCTARTCVCGARPFSPETPSCARSHHTRIQISALLNLLFSLFGSQILRTIGTKCQGRCSFVYFLPNSRSSGSHPPVFSGPAESRTGRASGPPKSRRTANLGQGGRTRAIAQGWSGGGCPMTRKERTLDCAITYADLGLHVIPLWSVSAAGRCLCGKEDCNSPGKHPYGRFAPNGSKNGTTDGAVIANWFAAEEEINIAICTGPDSGIVVLDVDPEHSGDETLANLEDRHGKIDTLEVITGVGGRHLYFKYPTGKRVKNSVGHLGAGLDVRSGGGYVVAPPSLHASGVHPKIAQILMRHCDINLTMNRYTHSYLGQANEAVARLPDFSTPSNQKQKAASTGTDDLPVENGSGAYKKLARTSYFSCLSQSPAGTTDETENVMNSDIDHSCKPFAMTELSTGEHPLSTSDTAEELNAPGRTRTCNLRIRSPRLYPIELRAQKSISPCNLATSRTDCQLF